MDVSVGLWMSGWVWGWMNGFNKKGTNRQKNG